MQKLTSFVKKYSKECCLGPLFKLLEALFELIVPLVVASIVDKGIHLNDTSYIIRMCLCLVGLAAVGLAFSVTAQYFAAKAAIGVSSDLRQSLLEHIQTLSYADLDHIGISTLITRMTGDINQVQSGINLGLRLLLRSPFVVFGAMIMAFTIDTSSALIFVAVIAVLLVVVFGIMLISIPKYKKVQSHLDGITSVTRENMNGVRAIRAFCLEESQQNRFVEANKVLTKSQNSVGRLSALLNPLTYVIINTALIVLLHCGALQIDTGVLTQGQFIALYNYMGQILVELIKMANLIITLTKAWACADRVSSVLNLHSSQEDGNLEPEYKGGSVEFRNVTLNYTASGDAALENISFSVQSGQTIGIIGGTGSGKSTLVNLIPRFYDATSGSVTVDGIDVRRFRSENLRNRIGIVPQKAMLFKGTIRSNLQWGNPNATDAELLDALSRAQAGDILLKKENGLDEPVEQGGTNYSGGQRQRLTIARALVKSPEILILDDSASALDFATDAALRKTLKEQYGSITTFIVSQRTSSVRFADRILVLEDGVLVGNGTHEELLESCPVYREIHESQSDVKEASHA